MSYDTDDFCIVPGTVIRTTDRAVLYEVRTAIRPYEKWIPRSVIEDGEYADVFHENLSIKEWFVDKEGL